MSANKSQFISKLAENSGLTLAQAESATNALPETFGEWLKESGAVSPGSFIGEIDGGLRFEMSRTMTPSPHWAVDVKFTASGLADFGDGATRFGLPVENA